VFLLKRASRHFVEVFIVASNVNTKKQEQPFFEAKYHDVNGTTLLFGC